MVKFKLVIKDAISGEEVKDVEVDEQIEASAKDKSYDILLKETYNLHNGDYTGELYRWIPNIEQWHYVGAPVLACNVKDGVSVLLVERVDSNIR